MSMVYETTGDVWRQETREHRFIVDAMACLLAFFMVYGFQILRLGLCYDEMWDQSLPLNGLYVAQGRFIGLLYRMLVGNVQMVPFAYGVSSAVYYAFAVALQIRIMRLEALGARLMYVAASVGTVHMANMIGFANQADVMILGIFLVTLGYYYYQRLRDTGKWYWGLLALSMLTIGTCCYQIHIFLFGALAVGDALRNNGGKTDMQRLLRLAWPAVLMGIAVGAYLVLKSLSTRMMLYFDDDGSFERCLHIVQNYQSGLIGWKSLPLVSNMQAIGRTLWELASGQMWASWVFPATALPALSLLWQWRKRPAKTILLFALWLLPLVPLLILAGGLEGRSSFFRICLHDAVPVAIVWALGVERVWWLRRLPSGLLTTLMLSMVLIGSYKVSTKAYEEKRIYEFSIRKAQEIIMAVYTEKLPEGVSPRTTPVVLLGGFPFHGGNTCSEKCITLFDGSYFFISNDMGQLTAPELWELPEEWGLQEPQLRELKKMPTYPQPGSIRYLGGKIYVRCPIDYPGMSSTGAPE